MIEYSIENKIGIIKLNSDNYNTLNSPQFTEYEMLNDFLNKGKIRAAIITGEGRHFCGGANKESLPLLSENREQYIQLINEGKGLLKLIEESSVPVISVVKGSCFGGGLEIALSTHFIFSSKTAMYGFPEVTLGLMPGLGGTIRGNKRLSRSFLTKMILTGDYYSSKEALDNGIVDFIYRGKEVFDKAVEFIENVVLKRDSFQIELILKSINNGYAIDRNNALRLESEYFTELASKRFSESKE